MPTKDLAAKYGKNKNGRVLVNSAIRAELPGGNETLEALTAADSLMPHVRSGDARPTLAGKIEQTLAAVQAIAAAMRAEIRKRYGMPPEDATGDDE